MSNRPPFRFDDEEKEVLYYVLRTPAGAVVEASVGGTSIFICASASLPKPKFETSYAFAKKINALWKRYQYEIDAIEPRAEITDTNLRKSAQSSVF